MFKTITWLLLSRLQGNSRPHRTGTLWNLRNPASATNTSTRNSPQPSGTFRNLPPEPTPVHQHPPKPSKTLRNVRNLPEPTGTFRNLPLEPTPAHTGTLRNLPERASGTYTSTYQNSPESSSGTCSRDPHRHTPELIWAEDPTSSRCWGIINIIIKK